MRYDELTLPIAAHELTITFHPGLTVLAGLTGAQRDSFVDSVCQTVAGSLPGGRLQLIDAAGRRHVVDAVTGPADAGRSPGDWRSLLRVGSDDLGLPRADDDPLASATRDERADLFGRVDELRGRIADATTRQRDHERAKVELQRCESRLAEMGTESDRHRHSRARTLVELEGLRAVLDAIDAPRSQIDRDARLIVATDQIQQLAARWAEVGEQLDQLRSDFGTRPRFDAAKLTDLLDVPDTVPETLRAALDERDRLRARLGEERAALEALETTPVPSVPDDPRILTLATVDQTTLWFTHRDVLLATEALHEAQRREEERVAEDPTKRHRVERAHVRVAEADDTVQRRWLPSVLTATVAVCVAALLSLGELWIAFVPTFLAISVAALILGVAIPRLASRRAHREARAALEAVGAVDIAEYRARFDEHPESDYFKRAEQIIADYEAAVEDWQALVGTMTPDEATELEEQVHDWMARTNRADNDRAVARERRRVEETTAELDTISARCATLLAPFKIAPNTVMLPMLLANRVTSGRLARLQIALADAEETEAKITGRLDGELTALGFEAGSLSTKIATFGREVDAAHQRTRLRAEGADHDEIERRIARLELRLSVPAPVDAATARPVDEAPSPAVAELRRRRDELTERIASFETVDIGALEQQLARHEGRLRELDASQEHGIDAVAASSIDHLVETLIRYRPAWPTTESEPAPVLLDDPFAAVRSPLKTQLLDALVEVSSVVQTIVLTDDPETVAWAVGADARGLLTLIAPTS